MLSSFLLPVICQKSFQFLFIPIHAKQWLQLLRRYCTLDFIIDMFYGHVIIQFILAGFNIQCYPGCSVWPLFCYVGPVRQMRPVKLNTIHKINFHKDLYLFKTKRLRVLSCTDKQNQKNVLKLFDTFSKKKIKLD